jgi:transposase
MQFDHVIGIDVSKFTLDCVCHHNGAYLQVENQNKGYQQLLKWARKQCGVDYKQILFCFEHTGIYSLVLAIFLDEKQIPCAVQSALAIKRSLGLVRGKTDKADARQIARYAYLHRGELKLYQLPSKNLVKLKSVLALRDRMVQQRGGYLASQKEYNAFFVKKENKELFDIHKNMIAALDKQIIKAEQQLEQIIASDEKLKQCYELMQSICGVGKITSYYMLVHTQAFTSFDNWRQFAAFCGIAPFENRSGTLIGKTKVSHLANKKVKSIFHLIAMSAIQCNREMKTYYQRRITEGKSKMSSLNIVRNKMLSRIFAVVKRGTPYQHMELLTT